MPSSRPNAGARRECREYERIWRSRCVDRNLHDDWLETLNSLDSFDLISVCEGHLTERVNSRRSSAHISLRIKGALSEHVADQWVQIQDAVDQVFCELLDPNASHAKAELRLSSRLNCGSVDRHTDLVVELRCRTPRSSHEPEKSMIDWFGSIVPIIRQLDRIVQGTTASAT